VLPHFKTIGGIMSYEISEKMDNSVIAAIEVLSRLFSDDDCWAITGSTNLVIRGARIQPSDIDIITTREVADRLASSTNCIVHLDFTLSATETIQSYYATATISNICIDIMADALLLTRNGTWQRLDTWAKSIEYFQTKVGLIPLTTLAFERKVHLLLGNRERVRQIDVLNNIPV
jgi:hypothetical protein